MQAVGRRPRRRLTNPVSGRTLKCWSCRVLGRRSVAMYFSTPHGLSMPILLSLFSVLAFDAVDRCFVFSRQSTAAPRHLMVGADSALRFQLDHSSPAIHTRRRAVRFPSSFNVDINVSRGTIRFPNKYKNWNVGGGSATNLVAYPEGWTIGGQSATNYVPVPPGWTVGGASATNFIAVPPGWTVGGGAGTNFVAVPPGWTVGGSVATHYVILPPGWTAGGGSATNYTALPPGWLIGGAAGTNYLALPPFGGWAVGGSPATNFVGYLPQQGWSVGGGSLSNFIALPPRWSTGGAATTNFVPVPPGWTVGGESATNFVAYPTNAVTIMELRFDDPGWVALFLALKSNGTVNELQLADVITYAYFTYHRGYKTQASAPSGLW